MALAASRPGPSSDRATPHADIPEEIRGTYTAIAHPIMIEHLHTLGVTAIELMPVHHFANDSTLLDKGLSNYWGYNTIGFFAPDAKYSSSRTPGGQEFKAMVRDLHAAGIEVILDVVYNHTAEGNHLGPTLSMRGIDNAAYYRLVDDDPQYYVDYTGTGNTLTVRHPHALQLLMDSLRYWVTEMHVDGFRFDLAAALAREFYDVDRLAAFFELVQQDPIVSQVKLIAEPRPVASINFVTAHDGFTLRDLASYNEKHNDANGEGNNDGESHNRSWNCGVEGPSDDAGVLALRAQQVRNFLATLLLSQGVPMICHGDELGRTQQGNNNGYCQDNELSWIDWSKVDEDLTAFTATVAHLRTEHPVFRRRRFFEGRPTGRRGDGLPDIAWLRPDASQMTEQDWSAGFGRAVAVFLNGEAITDVDARGERVRDDSFLLCFSAHDEPIDFQLPAADYGASWQIVVDTATTELSDEGLPALATLKVGPRALVVLQRAD